MNEKIQCNLLVKIGGFCLLLFICGGLQTSLQAGELDQFVRDKTSAFDYDVRSTEEFGDLGTGYRLKLTSQHWKNRTWTHDLRLLVPEEVDGKVPVFLVITGGEGAWKPIKYTAKFAEGSGYALALLGNVPNQPMFNGLSEDNLIAHTFVKFLETGDASWPLLFPMTRSVVRAMDALDELSEKKFEQSFSGYVLGGSSKRGWTSWLTGAVDERVTGMVPMVFDNLNVREQMKNQIDTWGAYTDKLKPYTKRNIPERLQSERGRRLVQLTDPYAYRERYDMPTLMISGTNDPYWPLNSVNLFRTNMQHELHQLYLPNTGHGVGQELFSVANTIKGFLMHVRGELTFPSVQSRAKRMADRVKLSWSTSGSPSPDQVTVWIARHDSSDFRTAEWKGKTVQPGTRKYVIKPGSTSHLACFARLSYTLNNQSVQLSTRVFLFDFEE